MLEKVVGGGMKRQWEDQQIFYLSSISDKHNRGLTAQEAKHTVGWIVDHESHSSMGEASTLRGSFKRECYNCSKEESRRDWHQLKEEDWFGERTGAQQVTWARLF
jgi:hypothetical protein